MEQDNKKGEITLFILHKGIDNNITVCYPYNKINYL